VLHVALAASLAASAAAADTEWVWRPRISATAGYDDNVALDGTGGDGFGQLTPGLKLDVFGEHQLRVAFDCQVGFARLQDPEEFGFTNKRVFANENCGLNTRVNLSERDKFNSRVDATYAQDPFALAGLGLLLRPGQTQIFVGRLMLENTHALSGHTGVNFGVDGTLLMFSQDDPGNGFVVAPRLAYQWKNTERSRWELGVREQLFFGIGPAANPAAKPLGLLGEAHTAFLGYNYQLTAWSEFTIRGGPAFLTANGGTPATTGNAVVPAMRAELNGYTPVADFTLTLAHDLMIGPSGGGALVGDIAEIGGSRRFFEQLILHLRLGAYRNASAYAQYGAGYSGYGGEVGAEWAFTRELRIGAFVARDARIYDPNVQNALVDRDVVQVRLTYERVRH
jgi:hypothetical protein